MTVGNDQQVPGRIREQVHDQEGIGAPVQDVVRLVVGFAQHPAEDARIHLINFTDVIKAPRRPESIH